MLIFTLGTLLSYTVYLPAAEQCYLVNMHPRRSGSKTNPTHTRSLAGSAFSLNSLFVLCLAHLHVAQLHIPWWPALGVTIPTVGNRTLHRRHRRHPGSRHCHNAAFLIDFRIADTLLVASIRWQTKNGIFRLRFSFFICNSPNANNSPGWPGFEGIELSMLRNLDRPSASAVALSGPDMAVFARLVYLLRV